MKGLKAEEPEHEFSEKKNGYSYKIDDDLKFTLLVDIDSLLFELNACCELMMRLFEALYRHVGNPIQKNQTGLVIKKVLDEAGQNPDWFVILDTHRNFFMHKGAPYIAVDLTKAPMYDLLIMKTNLFEFTDPSKFFTLSKLNYIVQGFVAAKPIIQDDLIKLYKQRWPE